jgi:hypothetical protein
LGFAIDSECKEDKKVKWLLLSVAYKRMTNNDLNNGKLLKAKIDKIAELQSLLGASGLKVCLAIANSSDKQIVNQDDLELAMGDDFPDFAADILTSINSSIAGNLTSANAAFAAI